MPACQAQSLPACGLEDKVEALPLALKRSREGKGSVLNH